MANPNDLYVIQTELDSKTLTREQVNWIKQDVQTGVNTSTEQTIEKKANPPLEVKPIQDALQAQGFYFDNDVPKGSVSKYSDYYSTYTSTSTQSTYQKWAPSQSKPYETNPQIVSSFFNETIIGNYSQINEQLNKIGSVITSIQSINFELVGTTSAPAKQSYNIELSKRRIESVKKYIQEYIPAGQKQSLSQLLEGRLTFEPPRPEGESKVSVKKGSGYGGEYNCSDKDSNAPSKEIYTVNAMACRRVAIAKVTIKPKDPTYDDVVTIKENQTIVTTQQQVQQITQQQVTEVTEVQRPKLADNISKRVLRLLLSECDYFQSIKEDTPMVYDNLKDKLQFFNPAFHSTTPEGLNSRLTFLNQCMRPGDTIPTVKSVNGRTTLDYSNATNTAFGTPPVLILRVGDFYNTKIIPDSLQIQYENLDLNPEGIGIQPMIANVTLSFKFVGGSGIKEAVDKIQNALTFNYYANTEIYDDRAEATDLESLANLDAEFASLYGQQPPPTLEQVQNNPGQSNSSTIGQILTTFATESGTTGTISYTQFMSEFVEGTQNYFKNNINKNKEILAQYNEAIRQQATLGLNYTNGEIIIGSGLNDTYLYGKPSAIQKNVDLVFEAYLKNIQDDQDLFLNYMSTGKNFSNKMLRTLKSNYTEYVKNKRGSYLNGVFTIIQDLTNQQTSYNNLIAKYNTVTYGRKVSFVLVSGTDGYQPKGKNPEVYYLTGSTTLNDMVNDGATIRTHLKNYIVALKQQTNFSSVGKNYNNFVILEESRRKTMSKEDTYIPLGTDTKFNSPVFQRQYALLSPEITDDKKYQTFKNQIIGNILTNTSLMEQGNSNLEAEFDNYWKIQTKPVFEKENKTATEFLNFMETNKLKDYTTFVAVDKKKVRELFYSNVPGSLEDTLIENRKKLINSLILPPTNTNKTTFNDSQGDIVITKTKFN